VTDLHEAMMLLVHSLDARSAAPARQG
jgi:hypothetical protein